MKTHFKILLIALSLCFMNCKNEAETINFDYKYADQEKIIDCEITNNQLYNEAVYAFENDIVNFYGAKANTTYKAYNAFFNAVMNKRINYIDIVTPETMTIFEALKKDKSLWVTENGVMTLDYNSPLMKCLVSNFNDKDLQATFNALVSTNSMSSLLFGAPIQNKISVASRDNYLKSYIAMDNYYGKLFNVNPDKVSKSPSGNPQVQTKTPNQQVVQPVKEEDPHAGHNH